MTPHWQQTETARHTEGPVFMDAVLTPNRALSGTAFTLLLSAVAGINLVLAVVFVLSGAWPVVGFLMLDVALVAGAFFVNYRDGRASERVLVDPDAIHLTRTDPKGRSRSWHVHPAWARVDATEDAVTVSAGASRLALAACLSPPERRQFREALAGAIRQARSHRPKTSEIE